MRASIGSALSKFGGGGFVFANGVDFDSIRDSFDEPPEDKGTVTDCL